MKSFVICRGDSKHSPHPDLRVQTRPGGDLEFVAVVNGNGDNMPTNKVVGVMPADKIEEFMEWLDSNP